ncbi:hypothetical protein [Longispora albida]|uniref:hypothetical protein n=1 Tax=Longispora albida TaxID=203523 RepID=UPI00037E7068|nr:hypothetical protein [Longispora albida]
MVDEVLSRAVVVYVWGAGGHRSWPGRDADAVRGLFGERAAGLLVRIDGLFGEVAHFFGEPGDLAEVGAKVRESLRVSHPELSAEACGAIASSCTFSWK